MPDPVEVRTQPPTTEQPNATRDGWATKLSDWAYQLTVLKVVTYVGQAEVKTNAVGTPDVIQLNPGGQTLATVCDLIGGDMTVVIDPALKDDASIREFHAQQVASAGKILPDNIKTLADLVKSLLPN